MDKLASSHDELEDELEVLPSTFANLLQIPIYNQGQNFDHTRA
jgi:hypothetical protein